MYTHIASKQKRYLHPKIIKVMNCIFKWICWNILKSFSTFQIEKTLGTIEISSGSHIPKFPQRFFSWVALMRPYTDADPHAFVPFVQQRWQRFFKLLSLHLLMDHSTKETKKSKKTCVSVPDLVVCVGVFFRLSKTVSAVFLLFENGP